MFKRIKWALLARDNKIQESNEENIELLKTLLNKLESNMTEAQEQRHEGWPTNLKPNNNSLSKKRPLGVQVSIRAKTGQIISTKVGIFH